MLKIFNTLVNKKELFKSINTKLVNMYVCGVTVSNYCHVGHGRTFYFFDTLLRYLIHLGYKCNYVRNITDIDNKLINKSLNKNISIKKISSNMILNMWKDFNDLGLLIPSFEPKITDNIELIIDGIKKLIKDNFAYISNNGDICFSVNKKINYGKYFSNRKVFKHINDFVLWKLNKNINFKAWDSPWGKGIPGWHIGCSIISNRYLNNHIDIHGGGSDLLFPHHENDLIQSKCLYKKKYFSNYWIHTGIMLNINGKKLSKSKKNVFFLKNLLKIYHPDIIKFFFSSKHYRKNMYFDITELERNKVCINKLYLCLSNLNMNITLNKKDILNFKEFDDLFYKYMNNDINLPKVQTLIFYMMHEVNKFKFSNYLLANKLAFKMKCFANIIGILNNNVDNFLRQNKNRKINFKIIKRINRLVKIRNIARKKKKWKIADSLRNELFKLNVFVNDKENFSSEWYFLN